MATSLTQEQIDTIVRTVLGEAAGEGRPGMEAVAWTILNRANSGKYPSDPAKVAKQPSQFSAWNSAANGGNDLVNMSASDPRYKQALEIVNDVLGGNVPDPTGGALFYHTQNISPYWSDSVNNYGTVGIGAHQFYPSHPVPPMNIPDVASQTDTTAPYSPAIPLPKPPPLYAPDSFSPPSLFSQMRGRGQPATGAPTMTQTTGLTGLMGGAMDPIGTGPIGGGQFREDLAPPRPAPPTINIPGSPGASMAGTGSVPRSGPPPSSIIERGQSYPNPNVLLNYAAQVAASQGQPTYQAGMLGRGQPAPPPPVGVPSPIPNPAYAEWQKQLAAYEAASKNTGYVPYSGYGDPGGLTKPPAAPPQYLPVNSSVPLNYPGASMMASPPPIPPPLTMMERNPTYRQLALHPVSTATQGHNRVGGTDRR